MTYDTAASPGYVLDVLGDPTRRRILELLRERPRAVVDLAARLPVSRPAVSRHLRLLKEAGLVSDLAEGTRRIYRVRPEGFGPVIAYWDRFWSDALGAFQTFAEAEQETTMTDTTLVVRHEITVGRSRDDTFRLFVEEIGAWWPLDSHSIFAGDAASAVLEPVVGGRVYERASDGRLVVNPI